MKIFRHWRIIYAVCSLVYMGWTINVGTNEFDRIDGQYQRLVSRLDAGLIRTAALEELKTECRRASRDRGVLQENTCLSWRPAVVKAREKEIKKQRLRDKERGTIKLVLFYAGFVFLFLLAPPLFIYLLLIAATKLHKSIKIIR